MREKGCGPLSDIEVAEQLLRSIKNLMSMKRLAETASRSARRLRSLGRKDVAGSLERMVPGLQEMMVKESQKLEELSRRLEKRGHRR